MNFDLNWFTTVPGLLISCGVLLLFVALIVFIISSVKSKKEKNPIEMDENSQGEISISNQGPMVEGNVSLQQMPPVQPQQTVVSDAVLNTNNNTVQSAAVDSLSSGSQNVVAASMGSIQESAVIPTTPAVGEVPVVETMAPVAPVVAEVPVVEPIAPVAPVVPEVPVVEPIAPVAPVVPEVPVVEPIAPVAPVVPEVPVVEPIVPVAPVVPEVPVVEPIAPVAPVVPEVPVVEPIAPVAPVVPEVPVVEPVAPVVPEVPVVEPVAPVAPVVPVQPVIYGGASPAVSDINLGQDMPHQIYGGANPLENTQSIPIASIPSVQPVINTQPTMVTPQVPPVTQVSSAQQSLAPVIETIQ